MNALLCLIQYFRLVLVQAVLLFLCNCQKVALIARVSLYPFHLSSISHCTLYNDRVYVCWCPDNWSHRDIPVNYTPPLATKDVISVPAAWYLVSDIVPFLHIILKQYTLSFEKKFHSTFAFWPSGNVMSVFRNVSFVSKSKFSLEKCYRQFTKRFNCMLWMAEEGKP